MIENSSLCLILQKTDNLNSGGSLGCAQRYTNSCDAVSFWKLQTVVEWFWEIDLQIYSVDITELTEDWGGEHEGKGGSRQV